MIRVTRLVFVVLLLAAAAAPALAQDPLSKRVSLDLKAMTPPDAFKVLADAVGLKVTVDAAVTAPVDILVKNVRASTALTTMCESVGCAWSVSGGVLAIKPAGPAEVRSRVGRKVAGDLVDQMRAALNKTLPADMKFENTPLTVVSQRLSDVLGVRLTITNEDASRQTLTADLGNQSLERWLKSLDRTEDTRVVWRVRVSRLDAAGPDRPEVGIMFVMKPRPPRK
jgi:hypothetical protein